MAGLVQVVSQPLSQAESSEKDMRMNEGLMELMTEENLLPSDEESQRRTECLGKLNGIVREFIKRVYEKKGVMDHYVEGRSFQLRTFGSYRLDVHLPGADMDTVLVVCRHVDRKDMFGDLYPTFKARKDVTDLIAVEEARVPVIKFSMDEFEFDLAMAVLPCNQLPEDFDVTDDRHLRGVDTQSVTSLNGVRVTDTIQNLVPTMKTLKFCIRALKLWAKRRGVYKNVLGFLGGISLEIMAARIGQLYPKALPSKLLYFFFVYYAGWKWPQPVGLTEINPNSNDLNLQVWCGETTERWDRQHVMPIITPVYPAQNATANVSKSTLKIMVDEFCRGRDIIKEIETGKADWAKLFEPLDSFKQYANFLQIQAIAPTKADYDMWKGFTEANVRSVVNLMERHPDAYVERAHPVQRNFLKPRASEEEPYEHYWFVGLKFDMEKLRGDGRKAPNIVQPVKDFKTRLIGWPKRREGMSLTVASKKQKDLPDFVINPPAEAEEEREANMEAELQAGQQTETEKGWDEKADKTDKAADGESGAAHTSEEVGDTAGSKRPADDDAAEAGAAKRAKGAAGEVKKEKSEADAKGKTEGETKSKAKAASSMTADLVESLRRGPEVRGDLQTAAEKAPPKKQMIFIKECQELRLEVEAKPVVVTVETGNAEVFGAEAARGEPIELVHTKVAFFSWQGCSISILGEARVNYVGETTPMRAYANLHAYLEQERADAKAVGVRGPRVMVVGPPDSGRTSVVRTLVNYAARVGQRPTLVDLDVARGFFVPGALGAMQVCAAQREGLPEGVPLTYFFGARDVAQAPDLFSSLVADLTQRLEAREANDPEFRHGGCVIDTFPFSVTCAASYSLLLSTAQTMRADLVLVMDMDRLFCDLRRDLASDDSVKVLKLPKSGGVVTVDPGHRKATAKRLVHEYLYGPRGLFCPRPIVLPFAQLRLFQVSAAQIAPQDALPIGFQAAEAHTQVKQVEPDASMVRRILAVAGQEPQDVQELASANSAGFVVLQDVDVEGKRVTVLAPNGLPMPSNVFLLGDLDFIE